ncbi:MAG TPA: DUF6067 family protein, partial [Armatimonadota bacterium]|nr:DUF6067 family protein [Armatimonadota bacterium]
MPIPIDAATMYPHSEWADALICYDDANLYVGYDCPKPPGPLTATEDARDGAVWQDDSCELFLNPLPDTPKDYFQFIANCAGAFYDARYGEATWDGDVTFAADVAEERWTIEAMIPFSELGAPTPKPGDMWLGNFCRDHHRPEPASPVYTTWAYLQSGFLATPERYGRLIFSDSTQGARLALSPTLNTGMLDAQIEGTPGTLSASVASGEGVALAKTVEVTDAGGITERLQSVKEGTLSVSLEDADGQVALSHSMRFMVKEPIDVAYLPDPLNKRLGLILDLTNIDADWLKPVADGQAELVVKHAGPGGDAGEETLQLEGARGTHVIPFGFETGEYEMEYQLTEPGHARPMLMVKTLDVPPLPWVGTRVGITDEVLAPWTPLEYGDEGTISCWGREHAFDGPFLKAATNQGRDILAGPVSMELTTAAGTGSLTNLDAQRTREDPNRAEFDGTGNFGEAQVDVEWSMWMEYDGLTVATVTLNPGEGGTTASDLRLRIPVRSDVVKYLRGARQMGGLKTGRLEWDGERYEGDFTPFLWACNETEGLAWICESQAGWAYPEGDKPVIVRGGEDASIEIALISQEVTFEVPLTYTFGFQATPVKPMAEDRRAWNFGMHGPTPNINARNWMTTYAEQDGHFKVLDAEGVREFDAAQRAEGVKLLYYGTTSCTPDHNPTFDLYEKLWGSSYSASYPNRNEATQFRPAWVPYRLASVCPGSPSFQDFMLHYADEFMRECGVPGVYTDTDGIMACDNAHHGHGFTDIFGKTGVTYTILSKRRYAMRQAAIVRSFDDERRYWMTHAHAKLVPPVHCWADFWLPGEENTHNLRGNRWWYIDTLDDVAWRVEYHGASSGLVHEFLPEFVRGTKDKTDMDGPQPTESMIAMCAVADANTTGAYLNKEAIGSFWGLRARLDLIEADFTGYWEADCPVGAITEKALASVYRTNDGAVIAVANRLP